MALGRRHDLCLIKCNNFLLHARSKSQAAIFGRIYLQVIRRGILGTSSRICKFSTRDAEIIWPLTETIVWEFLNCWFMSLLNFISIRKMACMESSGFYLLCCTLMNGVVWCGMLLILVLRSYIKDNKKFNTVCFSKSSHFSFFFTH